MTDLVSNRKAFYNYEILETFEAGISLCGSEVKSLRAHGGSLQDAYVDVRKKELYLIGASISPYSQGGSFVHEEKRDRKLLMHKMEIFKLERLLTEKNLTIIPIAMYLKNGKIKVKIATARGKKSYDKRAKLKDKEHKKTIQKAIRS